MDKELEGLIEDRLRLVTALRLLNDIEFGDFTSKLDGKGRVSMLDAKSSLYLFKDELLREIDVKRKELGYE